jgi:hypothetical protein
MVSIPTLGDVSAGLLHWWAGEMAQHRELILSTPCVKPFVAARNAQIRAFLASPATHILMVDHDVVPPIGAIAHLLKRMKELDAEYVALPVPATDHSGLPYPVVLVEPAEEDDVPVLDERGRANYLIPWERLRAGETLEVAANGMACSLIARSAVERLRRPWFEDVYDDDGLLIREGDFTFSDRLKEAGVRLWVDGGARWAKHQKQVDLLQVVDSIGVRNLQAVVSASQARRRQAHATQVVAAAAAE